MFDDICAYDSAGPCQANPCRNGGTCTAQDTTNYTCSCAAGFTGLLCETDPPDCEPTTCDNGGTCVEEYGPATHCICTKDFTGVKCTTCISGKFLFTVSQYIIQFDAIVKQCYHAMSKEIPHIAYAYTQLPTVGTLQMYVSATKSLLFKQLPPNIYSRCRCFPNFRLRPQVFI